MKKNISLFLVAFIFIVNANAQKGVHLIAKGGLNYSKIADNDFNASYHAGASLEIDFSKVIGLQPEILFSQLNNKGTNGNKDDKLNYLSIPLLLRINVSKMFTINVGPEYSILMNKNEKFLGNIQNAFKEGNFSMIGGVQLNLQSFRVYARYDVGLSNLNNTIVPNEWKSQNLQVGVGIKIF